MKKAAINIPGNVNVFFDYNEILAHKIYAGCDGYIMSSKFEPCGLSQMIALAYGTIPIVSKTGELLDTISCYDNSIKGGNGFIFDMARYGSFVQAILKAYKIFKDKKE